MKSLFSRPYVVVPLSAVIAIIVGIVVLPGIGKAPIIPASLSTPALVPSSNIPSGTSIGLAFEASGRVGTVNVKVGDTVTKGETLASLDTSVAQGNVNQAKAALDLANAQYASSNIQYANAKEAQDALVGNAYRTLLSSSLQAMPIGTVDESHTPAITGTYSCGTEGSYEIAPYASGGDSGYSFSYSGLESGSGIVTYSTPQPIGTCGLFITFVKGFSGGAKWMISIPNTNATAYNTNKNAYDLALKTRDETLSQLSANIGANGSTSADIASAAIYAAEGAYESALAQLQNNIIVAPADGTVTYVDSNLAVGSPATPGQNVISLNTAAPSP